MPPVQIPEQKAKIPGILILGAFVTKPPIKDDDICPVDSDINIQIGQLDGNMSICSNDSYVSIQDMPSISQNISVQIGHRPVRPMPVFKPPTVRKTIRRDNKVLQAPT